MVAKPRRGGLGRTVNQPGTVLAFDKADLYAKVSGYLIRQKVDIGDLVKKGEVLAEVDVPELFKSRDQARAALGQARAKVKLSEARVLTAEADREAAAARGHAGRGRHRQVHRGSESIARSIVTGSRRSFSARP